jgi:lipopolysaccharide export system protein LptA
VLEADSIELLRDGKVLNAAGAVKAVFPQTTAPPAGQALAVQATTKKPVLWHVTAGTLTYSDAENRARLGKNVALQSAEQRIHAAAMDLYFTGGGSANPSGVAKQVSRAIGTGGVIVEQGVRKATAERGEYTASEGKFVMSGGNPTIYDASQGTTTGRQLTFFLADDTIIVDSENGSRTLTKHRVEK